MNEANAMGGTSPTTSGSKPATTSSIDSKPSEFWTVFSLSILLGVFGAHRFYARKFKSAIVQLVTFGGLGIWSFIDVLMILLSKFKNANGVVFKNPKPKVAWSIFAVVCVLATISAANDKQSDSDNSSGSRSGSVNSSSAGERKMAGIYQCANPSWTLQLKSNGSYVMQALDTGDTWQGTWSADGNNGSLVPTTAASLSFSIESDGAIIIDKYGYTFVRTQ